MAMNWHGYETAWLSIGMAMKRHGYEAAWL